MACETLRSTSIGLAIGLFGLFCLTSACGAPGDDGTGDDTATPGVVAKPATSCAGLADGALCDDGEPCTVGDTCAADKCKAGPDLCGCRQDKDCDGSGQSLCLGTPYCDLKKLPYTCRLNTAKAISCPSKSDTGCLRNLCDPASGACKMAAVNDKQPCEDGDTCTLAATCDDGKCSGGTNVCACAKDSDCEEHNNADNLCLGTWFCDADAFPKVCKINPATVVQCSATKDTTCSQNACNPKNGKCAQTPVANGSPCDDGDKCTNGDTCKAGSCSPGEDDICACDSDADCDAEDDGDLCNGIMYCDKGGAKPVCKLNPSTVVSCPTVGDSACLKNVCYPKVGLCQPTPIEKTAPNCDKVPKGSKNCPHELLAAGKGSGKTTACDDGNPCSEDDYCNGGACVGGTGVCACTSDAQCEKKLGDGDACNGLLYCNKLTQKCQLNPASAVSCPSVDNTTCSKNACSPKTGKCVASPTGKVKQVCQVYKGSSVPKCNWVLKPSSEPETLDITCDDGDKCSKGDTCKAGKCAAGADTCLCKADADCAAQEDGNQCNGTLYCDMASKKCLLNPKTAIICPTVDDTACIKRACQPKSGKCALTPVEQAVKVCAKGGACRWELKPAGAPAEVVLCEDGNPCTKNDICGGGSCKAGAKTCCWTDTDCAAKDDGNKCNGTWYCDKSGKVPACKFNPVSVVVCAKQPASICLQVLCNPASGQCGEVGANEAKACNDGSVCTDKTTCQSGQCKGSKKVCDDGDACTSDMPCDPVKGCVHTSKNLCDDGNSCTQDKCDPKTGNCNFAPMDGKTCDADGSPCTVNDHCQGKTCKAGSAVSCKQPAEACKKAVCIATKDNKDFTCLVVAKKENEPCADSAGCTVGAHCDKNGKCIAGDKERLFEKALSPSVGAQAHLRAVLPLSDGRVLLAGGSWTGTAKQPQSSAWYVAVRDEAGDNNAADKATWSQTYASDVAGPHHAIVAVRPQGNGDFLLAGTAPTKAAGLNAQVMRINSAGQQVWKKQVGKAQGNDEVVLGADVHGNGAIALIGYRELKGKRSAVLWRLSSTAQPVWEVTIGKSGDEGRAVRFLGNGDVLALWQASGGQGKLERFDAKKNSLWSRSYGINDHVLNAMTTLGAGHVLVGHKVVAGVPYALTIGVEGNGYPLWKRTVKVQSTAYAVSPQGAGRLAIFGTSNSSGANPDAFLMQIDAMGNTQWQREIDGGDIDAGSGIATLADGGLVMVGKRAGNGKNLGLFRRTDAWGHGDCKSAGLCQSKTAQKCDDGKPCTADSCVIASGGCSHQVSDDFSCDPDDGCSTSGTCSKGICLASANGKLFIKTQPGPVNAQYGHNKAWRFDAVIRLADGGYAAAATTTKHIPGKDKYQYLYWLRFDKTGAPIDSQQILKGKAGNTLASDVIATDMTTTATGGYVIVGFLYQTPQGQKQGFIYRLDSQGKTQWSLSTDDPKIYGQQIKGAFHTSPQAIARLADGSLAIPTPYYKWGWSGHRYVVISMKSNGDLKWLGEEKAISDNGFTTVPRDIAALADGGVVVAGYSVWGTTPNYLTVTPAGTPSEGMHMKFDIKGKVVWYKRIAPISDGRFRATTPMSDGGVLFAGDQEISGKRHAWLYRVDAKGGPLWQQTFEPLAGSLRLETVDVLKNGELALTGTTSAGVVDRIWQMRADPTGNHLWQQTYKPGTTARAGRQAVVLDDGGLVMVGSAVLGGDDHGVLMRSDPWGKAGCAAAGKCLKLADCDDGNPCTLSKCDASKGCVHTAHPCSDGNQCTTDKCDPQKGCQSTPNGCDDGNACTQDTCTDISCSNAKFQCNDGNPCTKDACVADAKCGGTIAADTCYKLHKEKASWSAAVAKCEADGRQMVSIGSWNEQLRLRLMCSKKWPNKWFHLGLAWKGGQLIWLDGTPYTFSRWTWKGYEKGKKDFRMWLSNGEWHEGNGSDHHVVCEGFPKSTCSHTPVGDGALCGGGKTCKAGLCK